MTVARPSGSISPERLEDAVGAGGVVRTRHHRPPAGLFDRRGDLGRIGRHHHRSDAGRLGALGTCTIIGRPAMSASGFPGQPGWRPCGPES